MCNSVFEEKDLFKVCKTMLGRGKNNKNRFTEDNTLKKMIWVLIIFNLLP